MTAVTRERLAQVFVEMADTLVADFDLIEFLGTVTVRTAEVVGVDAVGLLLADQTGRLMFMAASDERTKLLELFQVQNHDGPCLDAFTSGTPVVTADLREVTERWPLFAPRAVAVGYRSVHAFPLRLRDTVIGALNLFGREVGGLGPLEVELVQALGDIATIGLLQERTIRRGEVLTEQLQGALNSRIVIEQAKGVLAHTHGISVDEAFKRLRATARTGNLKLVAVAHSVIDEATPG